MSTYEKDKNASFKATLGVILIIAGFIVLVSGKPMVGDPTITDMTPLSFGMGITFIILGALIGYKNFNVLLTNEKDPKL